MNVMASKYCRDSLTQLMEMDFHTFCNMEMYIVHQTYRDEERAWNKYMLQKNQ